MVAEGLSVRRPWRSLMATRWAVSGAFWGKKMDANGGFPSATFRPIFQYEVGEGWRMCEEGRWGCGGGRE